MIRWVLAIFLALVLLTTLHPWLRKLGIGRLPGDVRFRLFGREFFVPLTSTLVLSAIAGVLSRML